MLCLARSLHHQQRQYLFPQVLKYSSQPLSTLSTSTFKTLPKSVNPYSSTFTSNSSSFKFLAGAQRSFHLISTGTSREDEEKKKYFSIQSQIRSYARRTTSSRRVEVMDRPETMEETETRTRTQPVSQTSLTSRQRTEYESEAPPEYESLKPGVVNHLRKVYSTLASTSVIAAGGTLITMFSPLAGISPIIPGLLSFAPLLALYYSDYRTSSQTLRMGYLASFAFLGGMSLAPLIKMSLLVNPMAIPLALGISTGIFGAMTFLSLFAKKGALLKWGVPLGGGALVLLGVGIAGMFVSPASAMYPLLHSVWTYGGIALFSAFTAYDTQATIAEYEAGEKDVLRHAVNFFINLKGLFVHILSILTRNND